jgi:hypothetical protein
MNVGTSAIQGTAADLILFPSLPEDMLNYPVNLRPIMVRLLRDAILVYHYISLVRQ